MIAVAKEKSSGFGARLRALREAHGLTQAELAEATGMLRPAVARLEMAQREPTWPTVLKLADALGVSTDAFRINTELDE